MKTLVVIPTYNEAENISRVVEKVRTAVPFLEVLVVDDGSPDGTADVAERLAHVLRRTHKQGLGPAYLAGFAWALERGYERIIEMDADGSHRSEDLPTLLAAADDADLVIGSRWTKGGKVVRWPATRRAISRLGNWYVRAMLGMPIKDATAGFRIYSADLLRRLDLGSVDSNGYCFQIDLTYRAHRARAKIVEVPITFVERESGVSKMSGHIVFEALLQTTKWGLGRASFVSTKER